MGLFLEENAIRELAKSPKHREEIQKARIYQDKLLRHSFPYLNRDEAVLENTSIRAHFKYAESILDPIQYCKYKGYYKFPQSTLKITDEIFSDLKHIFKPSDRVEQIEINNPNKKTLYANFYKGFKNWLKIDGYQIYRQRTCNLLFIDMPLNEEGEPIYYEVDIDNCIDYQPNNKGMLDYALFDNGEGYIWVDAEKWILFNYKDETEEPDEDFDILLGGVELGPVLGFATHELGITPCIQFWKFDFNNKFTKETAISKQLADLDSYDFLENGKDHNDLINIFPAGWSVRNKCGYDQNNQSCNSGFVVDKSGGRVTNEDGGWAVCPTCKGGNAYLFAGVKMAVDPSTVDIKQTTEPAGFITLDPKVLEHINAEITLRADNIKRASIGESARDKNNQAKNETQISNQGESQEIVYMHVKSGFEAIEEWFVDVTARLWFDTAFESVNIDYGRKFLNESLEQQQENFSTASASGMPKTLLLNDLRNITETKFRNDQKGKEEANQWLDIEPYIGIPSETVDVWAEKERISSKAWNFYTLFSTLKSRFDDEYGSITNFGASTNISKAAKNRQIKEILLDWLNDELIEDELINNDKLNEDE